MTTLRHDISSLSALVAFEAAARLGSFSRAAQEMGVTQAAISRQIKALEADLQTLLFVRAHRKVELTRAGALLSNATTGGFNRISETIGTLRLLRAPETVSVGATLALSHFWLLPRLTSFRRYSPDLQLRVISQDEGFDLHSDDAQIVIRYGRPPFAGARVIASLADRIFPVCSPAFRDRHGGFAEDRQLFALPLIATDWRDPDWSSWGSWAEAAGFGRVDLQIALRFSHYTDTVYAAMNGEGVALGWENLLSQPLRDGRLVRLGRAEVVPPAGYHVIVSETSRPDARAAKVLAWLAEEFGRTPQDT